MSKSLSHKQTNISHLTSDQTDLLKKRHQYCLGKFKCQDNAILTEGNQSRVTSKWKIHDNTLSLECEMETELTTQQKSAIQIEPQINLFFNVEG